MVKAPKDKVGASPLKSLNSIAHGQPATKPIVSPSSSHHGLTYLCLMWASYMYASRNIV